MINAFKKNQQGITLLEAILALAIGGMVAALSVQQYQSYKLSADIDQVNVNVDKLFQAASYYFRYNCNKDRELSPTEINVLVPIDIQTDLINAGYFREKDIVPNPLVDNEASGTWDGYLVQFNRYTSERKVCTNGTAAVKDIDGNIITPAVCNTYSNVGTIVGWLVQVSVALKDPTKANVIKQVSTATCMTSMSGTSVMPCGAAAESYAETCTSASTAMTENTPAEGEPESQEYLDAKAIYDGNSCSESTAYGNFLSYIRGATFNTALEAQSGLSLQNKGLQQFKQMYETMPITQLLSVDHTTEYQYFYCGG